MQDNNGLKKLYIDQLNDLYSGEQQILKALPKMAQKASHPELRDAFNEHEQQTRQHVQRLEQVFQQLGEKAGNETCKGMQGILSEGDEVMNKYTDSDVLDAALIAAAQRVEHYEMAGYGCVCTYADTLGMQDQAELLQQTLEDEEDADQKLSDIAESVVNADAMDR
ncbi:MAG: ferritin-like domain-containing protein [Gemmatimonadaceae bacterium]